MSELDLITIIKLHYVVILVGIAHMYYFYFKSESQIDEY